MMLYCCWLQFGKPSCSRNLTQSSGSFYPLLPTTPTHLSKDAVTAGIFFDFAPSVVHRGQTFRAILDPKCPSAVADTRNSSEDRRLVNLCP